ncbi:MAG: FeoB-associated Cys-rich membrane protein [Sphingobacteriales bacterium]|nr:MAG: FeoB-associated Cys-rich membrane protein [Sphingobacteriales bacterium]TAF83151.1 MAG: FeoB-associated Cys-rich membrane protein [Sphingobacteriales bacterium]
MQSLFVFILFIAALGYLASLLYKSFTASKGCANHCTKCKVEFEKP